MRKALVTILAVAAIIGIVLFLGSNSPNTDPAEEAAGVSATTPSSISSSADDTAAAGARSPGELPAESSDSEAPPCADFRPDRTHPWVIAEMARLEPLTPEGPGMAVYRGLSETDLKSLAEQKDSGAMLVLGKRAELRAEGRPENDAVDQLDGQSSTSRIWRSDKELETDVRAALEEAEQWYYQAVLHGRIYAMFKVGLLRETLHGGPVEFGWVDADAYAEMDLEQQADFYPGIVYGAAASAIAPEIVQSPMMTLALEEFSMTVGDPATVEIVISDFRADLERHGLTLPDIPPYEGPGVEEWRAEFCRD